MILATAMLSAALFTAAPIDANTLKTIPDFPVSVMQASIRPQQTMLRNIHMYQPLLDVSFTINSKKTADRIRLVQVAGNGVAYSYTFNGKFSPGTRIENRVASPDEQGNFIFSHSKMAAGLHTVYVHFTDGTTWNNSTY